MTSLHNCGEGGCYRLLLLFFLFVFSLYHNPLSCFWSQPPSALFLSVVLFGSMTSYPHPPNGSPAFFGTPTTNGPHFIPEVPTSRSTYASSFTPLASPFGIATSLHPAVMESGLQFGQQVIRQELHKGKETIVPFFDALRVYFSVDHRCVLFKLWLLIFPFYPRRRKSNSNPQTPDASASFDAPAAQPLPARNPLCNPFAVDLYVPLMSVLTYMVLSACLSTRSSEASSLQYFSSACWITVAHLAVEALVLLVVGKMIALFPRDLKLLDLAALLGYKYVMLSLISLLSFLQEANTRVPWWVLCYAILASFLSTAQLFRDMVDPQSRTIQSSHRTDWIPSSQVSGMALAMTLIQVPSTIWLSGN